MPWEERRRVLRRRRLVLPVRELRLGLTELVSLQVVLLFGEKPLTGWFKIATQLGKLLPVLASPHPSPRSLNSHPERRGEILRTLQATRALTATS